MKRKFIFDSDDAAPNNKKQLKLIPFPNVYVDDDVPMSEAEPLYPEFHHSRAPSDVSSTTSNESNSPLTSSRMLAPIPFNSFLTGPAVAAAYPTFDLYPLPFFTPEGSVNTNSHNYRHYSAQSPTPMVGLLQPSSSFSHHGSNCSQIPKLRVACASGPNGQRTMWSFCEQCGAISMVETD